MPTFDEYRAGDEPVIVLGGPAPVGGELELPATGGRGALGAQALVAIALAAITAIAVVTTTVKRKED